jgi:hypothetical protein
MSTRKNLAAALGFAFVAAWIAFSFGEAVLCLLGAALFYAIASFLDGELDLADLQDRLSSSRTTTPSATTPRPRPRAGARVQ